MMEQTTPATRNLYQRLAAVNAAIGAIEKTGRNQFFNFNYIEHKNIVATLRPILAEEGVVMLATMDTWTQDLTRVNAKQAAITHSEVTMTFTFINSSDPAERESFTFFGECDGNDDKTMNKAVIACHKSMLKIIFFLSDVESVDSDGQDGGRSHSAEDGGAVRDATRAQTPRSVTPVAPRTPARPVAPARNAAPTQSPKAPSTPADKTAYSIEDLVALRQKWEKQTRTTLPANEKDADLKGFNDTQRRQYGERLANRLDLAGLITEGIESGADDDFAVAIVEATLKARTNEDFSELKDRFREDIDNLKRSSKRSLDSKYGNLVGSTGA